MVVYNPYEKVHVIRETHINQDFKPSSMAQSSEQLRRSESDLSVTYQYDITIHPKILKMRV